jgi:hypothetical protein
MTERNLRIVKPVYPMTGTCENCNQPFMSRNEDHDLAARDIKAQFDNHQCARTTASSE